MSNTFTRASITLELTITDRRRLMRAALEKALANGLTANEWRAIRRGAGLIGDSLRADIEMLFDPGSSPEGIEIADSNVELF
jgi:hypothetical protein